MERRTDKPLDAQKLFEDALYSPFQWPWKTTRLESNSLETYRQRPLSATVSIAELYHENSKLFPQMLSKLTVSRLQEPSKFRLEFIQRRAAMVQKGSTLNLDGDQPWQKLLMVMTKTIMPDLFYAVELQLVIDTLLLSYEPLSATLQAVKQLSVDNLEMLKKAFAWLDKPQGPVADGPLLFILGCFARNDILFGVRGYRRTLLEAGQVAQGIVHQAGQLGLPLRPVYEFIDHDVDAILEADGTEEGVLMAFELGGNARV